MTKLIDRQEVIENIENCLDKYGYVDTRKFADYMREIFAMPYKTEEQIRADAIEEFVNRLLNNEVIDKSVIRRIAEQIKKGEEDES